MYIISAGDLRANSSLVRSLNCLTLDKNASLTRIWYWDESIFVGLSLNLVRSKTCLQFSFSGTTMMAMAKGKQV